MDRTKKTTIACSPAITFALIAIALALVGCPNPAGSTAATYTVAYNANGTPISGTVPTDAIGHPEGASVTVVGNTGNLAMTGSVFAGWTTSVTGTGSSYAANATFTMGSANITLYAVWIPSNLNFTSSGTSITLTGYTTPPTGSLLIPGGVTSLGTVALDFDYSLTSVVIPSSVTSIGYQAFYYDEYLTSVTIPSSVTSIGTQAFFACVRLPSITIPSSVTSISFYAFEYCYYLNTVTVLAATPPALPAASAAFYDCGFYSTLQIDVPSGTAAAYEAATGWSDYYSPKDYFVSQ
jgi:hypothetical protein